MTGPEHYREAERLEGEWAACRSEAPDCPHCTMAMARAQVHATLALAAATAPRPPSVDLRNEWISAIYLPAEEP